MSSDLGSHLLGRKPSPPDERDYRAENFRSLGEPRYDLSPEELVRLGVTELTKTTITYKQWAARKYEDVTVTHWWKAFNAFAQAVGDTPPTPPPVAPVTDKQWSSSIQLDQEDTGHCVGFGFAAFGIAAPVEDQYTNADGHAIYYEAKTIEGNPTGEDGAYTRDGAKAMLARKRIGVYAFIDTEAELLDWIRNVGPIVVGTDWTTDMFEPDEAGLVKPTGNVEGGHCYLLIGVSGDYLIFKNSWGKSFGVNGYFRMKISDFMELMSNQGEAITSVELPL